MKILGRRYVPVDELYRKLEPDKEPEPEEPTIPDVVGRITAARAWVTRPGPTGTRTLLSTAITDFEWPSHRVLKATHVARLPWGAYDVLGSGERHQAPDARCSCGLWAVSTPHSLGRFMAAPRSTSIVAPVFGIVELWGRVVSGPDGWRGEYARVAGVVLRNPKHVRRAESQVATTYDVPLLTDWPELTPPSVPDELSFASQQAYLDELMKTFNTGGTS